MNAEDLRRYASELQDGHLFGALKRFHDEVLLPRDRPKDEIIKNGDNQDMWTGDVMTGGANGYFVRAYMTEYFVARDAGMNDLDASVKGFEAASKSYKKAVGLPL